MLPSGWKQAYKKVDGQWTQITNGKTKKSPIGDFSVQKTKRVFFKRKMTAEQLLSHILPLLVKGKKRAKLYVVKNLKKV
jgi:hypothetical protein